jgi:Domain of unknown function (DUF4157)
VSRTPVADHPPPARRPRPVSRPHDPAETQADRAADVVARGGSVSGWSFGSVPPEAAVHRDEKGAPPKDEEKLKEAAKKAGEAALETKAGKALQERVKETPVVKEATKFLDTTTGKVVAGGAIAAGVGGLAAAKQPLPFQAPAIPLDKVTPGLSAKLTVEGPVNAPTFVGLSLTYKEQVPKGKGGPTEKEQIAADIARLRAQQDMFKPRAQKQQEQADEQAAIASFLAQQSKRFGTSTLLPVAPAEKPKTVELPTSEPTEDEGKKKEEAPVQREPATAEHTEQSGLDTRGVDAAVRGGGRPLDPSVRRSMEARFGSDFQSVRIHDDPAAASAAGDLLARAFTVGEEIVFGSGGFDPQSPAGRHLLAHELAHVVQQRGATGGARRRGADGIAVQRVGVLESLARFLGGGTYSTDELRAYLEAIRRTGAIEDANDSDNKARDIVRRFMAGEPAFSVLTVPDRVLLIREMISGFTGDDDEQAILDLLTEAIPQERAAIVRTIGADVLKDNFHGEEFKRLRATIDDADEEVAFSRMGSWTVDGVLDSLERHGDVAVVREMLRLGWTVKRFDTAFDKWRYDDGRVEEDEVTGLRGNTVRPTKTIRLRASLTNDQASQTLFHELHHAFAVEPGTEDEYLEDEVQARVATEEFNIRHGFPPSQPGYRRPDGTVDVSFIRREIRGSDHYNPTGRERIGRRYVREVPVSGWRVRPTSTGPRGRGRP